MGLEEEGRPTDCCRTHATLPAKRIIFIQQPWQQTATTFLVAFFISIKSTNHKAMSPFIPNPKIIVGSLALLVLGHVSHYHAEAMSTNTGTPRSRTGNGTPRTSNTKNQKPTYYNYFAFGSNMASSTMTALRSLDPVASTAAILPNHRLAFNVPGTAFVEPSWASVEPLKEKDTNTNTNTNMNANDEKYVDNNDGNRNYRNGKNII